MEFHLITFIKQTKSVYQSKSCICRINAPGEQVGVTVMDQIICTRIQLKFQIFKNCNTKIGMNTTANKLFHVHNLIGLDMVNHRFVHFKKLAKIQFLKYGKT